MHIERERERKKDRAERPQQRWSGAEEEEEEEWSIKIRIRNGWSKEKGLRDVRACVAFPIVYVAKLLIVIFFKGDRHVRRLFKCQTVDVSESR